jgi:hypothetical protein
MKMYAFITGVWIRGASINGKLPDFEQYTHPFRYFPILVRGVATLDATVHWASTALKATKLTNPLGLSKQKLNALFHAVTGVFQQKELPRTRIVGR